MSDAAFDIADLLVRKRSGASAFELVVPRLAIACGDRVALVGPSGCGKSTLLDALSMILRPQAIGRFRFGPRGGSAVDVGRLLLENDGGRLAQLRKRWIGYVLQTGGLLSFLSVRRNIELSRRLLGLKDDGTTAMVADRLGLKPHLDKLPKALSVGERQRVAIARALAHRPSVIIADEPTAALDPVNAERVMASFVELADSFGTTIVVASHDIDRVRQFGLRLVEPHLATPQTGVTRAVFTG